MARSRNSAFLVAAMALAVVAGLLAWRWLAAGGEGERPGNARPGLAQGQAQAQGPVARAPGPRSAQALEPAAESPADLR